MNDSNFGRYMKKTIMGLATISTLMACTDSGKIHPAVLGIAGGVAAANNPDFDQDAFLREAESYYSSGTPTPSVTSSSSASSGDFSSSGDFGVSDNL